MRGRWLIGLALFGLGACARSADNHPSHPVPSDLRVVFGQGGGVTGLWAGCTVESTGVVRRWQGPIAEVDAQEVGVLNENQRAAMWTEITDARFFEDDRDERGNMTRRISVTANGNSHTVYWPVEVPSQRFGALDALYEVCEKATGQALSPQ